MSTLVSEYRLHPRREFLEFSGKKSPRAPKHFPGQKTIHWKTGNEIVTCYGGGELLFRKSNQQLPTFNWPRSLYGGYYERFNKYCWHWNTLNTCSVTYLRKVISEDISDEKTKLKCYLSNWNIWGMNKKHISEEFLHLRNFSINYHQLFKKCNSFSEQKC